MSFDQTTVVCPTQAVRMLPSCAVLLYLFVPTVAQSTEDDYFDYEREHWAFVLPEHCPVPTIENEDQQLWVRTPIDAFVLQQQLKRDLCPTKEADRATLARRLTRIIHASGNS